MMSSAFYPKESGHYGFEYQSGQSVYPPKVGSIADENSLRSGRCTHCEKRDIICLPGSYAAGRGIS